MSRPKPIAVGERFTRWTVISQSTPNASGSKRWMCRCECGVDKIVPAYYLRREASRSCGCLMREQIGDRNRKHGGHGTVEYIAWNAMVQRCTRASHPAFKNYGGRGIAVCAEWRHDFAAFLAHVGSRPSAGHSLDRIDNDRGYEPGNVRWATYDVQMINRRRGPRDSEGRFA